MAYRGWPLASDSYTKDKELNATVLGQRMPAEIRMIESVKLHALGDKDRGRTLLTNTLNSYCIL
ncbi:hypothetical protein D3C81_299350 [compost metagenome]